MKTSIGIIAVLVGLIVAASVVAADPPGREELDRAEDAAILAAVEKAAQQSDMPVSFFGKVLDQYDAPVEGAQVEIGLIHYDPKNAPPYSFSASKKIPLNTNAAGLFSVTNEHGSSLYISGISKAGYEFVRLRNKKRGFEYRPMFTDRHIPDKAKPVVFHLRKMGPTSFLLRSSGIFDLVTVQPDRKPVVVEFCDDQNTFLPDNPSRFPGFAVSASLDKDTDDWVLCLKGKHENDSIALVDHIVYEAPEQGYRPSAELRLSLQKNPIPGQEPTYPHKTEAYVVVRSAKSGTYTRAGIQLYPREEATCDIRYSITVNPYGERTFEWASELDEYWKDVQLPLQKEAIHALCTGQLPPMPDLPKLIEEAKAKAAVKECHENE